jgi:hypothetical protein
MPTKGIIALQASHSFTRPIFLTIPFLYCEKRKTNILKSGQ